MQLNGVRSEIKKAGARIRVTINEARGIYPTTKSGTTDAHCVIGLWTPTSGHKKGKMDQKKALVERTSEKAGTINPLWNEERILFGYIYFLILSLSYAFYAYINHSDVPDLPSVLENLYLLVEVWEKDKKFLGWAEVHIMQVANTQPHSIALPLQRRKPKDTVAGEIRITVTVIATNPLTKIEIQEEPLSQLPVFFLDAFWLPFYLQDFYMVQCGLTALSPRIGRWTMLKSLILAENQLKSLPEEAFQLINLEDFDISYNAITTISKSIGNLKKLKVIELHALLFFFFFTKKNRFSISTRTRSPILSGNLFLHKDAS